MPHNPKSMTSPHPPKNATIFSRGMGVEGVAGQGVSRVLIFRQQPYEWSFGGVIRTEQHLADFQYWTSKTHRVHLTDHLGRTWEIRMGAVDLDEKRPSHLTLWRYEYTVRATIYGKIS